MKQIWIGSLSEGIDKFYERDGRTSETERIANWFMASVDSMAGWPPLTFTLWRLDRAIDRCQAYL